MIYLLIYLIGIIITFSILAKFNYKYKWVTKNDFRYSDEIIPIVFYVGLLLIFWPMTLMMMLLYKTISKFVPE